MRNIKFNLTYCILAVAGAILIAIANHSLAKTDPNRDIAGLFSLVCYTIPLVLLLGASHTESSINVNLRVLSVLFFIVMLISNFAFSIWGVVMPYYIICNGLLLLVYIILWTKLSNISLK